MFNRKLKKRIDQLEKNLCKQLFISDCYPDTLEANIKQASTYKYHKALKQTISDQQKQIHKLKGIVAELTNYVYKDIK